MRERYEAEISNIIREVLMLDAETHVKQDQEFKAQFEMDSMDALDIIMQVKEKYALEIPKEDYAHFTSMDKLVDYLAGRKVLQ